MWIFGTYGVANEGVEMKLSLLAVMGWWTRVGEGCSRLSREPDELVGGGGLGSSNAM